MTIEQLGSLGEVIGAIAVVVSLVALAIQMRQNTKAIHAQAARDAEATWGMLNLELAKDAELSIIAARLVAGHSIDEFSEEQRSRIHFILRTIWAHIQSEHSLYLEGSLRPDVWERRIKWMRGLMQISTFSEFIDEELRQKNADSRLVEQILAADDRVQIGGGFAGR